MVIECPQCKAIYRIDRTKLPPKGVHVRCKICHTRFFIQNGSNAEVNLVQGDFGSTDVDPFHLKTEPPPELPFKDKEDPRTKLPVEEFVRRAIEKLRESPNKGIRMAKSGFAHAFKEYYGLDPQVEVANLVEKGKVVTRGEGDDLLIYLTADAPISDTLRRILDPAATPDSKSSEPRSGEGVLNQSLMQISREEPEREKSDVPMTHCAGCGAKAFSNNNMNTMKVALA